MLILSALAVFTTWVVIAVTLTGIGSIVLARFGEAYLFFDAFWMGLAISVAFLEIWSLLAPIHCWATIGLLAVGALGIIANRVKLFQRGGSVLRATRWWTLVLIAIVLFIALRASGPCDYYDTGLYGWPTVRWVTTYPVVPGLANLHGRLGFDSAVFLCIAALDQGVWRGRAHHLFTGLLMSAMILAILPGFTRVMRGRSLSPSDWFQAILAIPVVYWASRIKIVGTQTDEPATIACLAGAVILFDTLCSKQVRGTTQLRHVVAACLFALAIAFKVSTIVFAALAWCLAIAWIYRSAAASQSRKTYVVAALSVSVAILLPWAIRGIVLSGYPFFPATIFGFPVDWKVPLDQARWFAAGVKSFGRDPDAYSLAQTQGLGWLAGWLKHSIHDRASFQVPLAISLAGLAAALSLRGTAGAEPQPQPWLWLLLPSLAGIVFWFWASPDLRFAQFAIWTAAATLGAWGITAILCHPRAPYPRLIMAGLLLLMTWCLAGYGWKPPYRALFAAEPLASVPAPEVTPRATRSGLTVYVPKTWDNCWDAPLPCTPYFNDTLRLRDGQSLRRGFASQDNHDFLDKVKLR